MEIKTINQLLEYVETEEKANELIYYINKQKEVIDKIKEYIKEEEYQEEGYGTLVIETKNIKELLEKII